MGALMSVVRQFRSLLVQLEANPKEKPLDGCLRIRRFTPRIGMDSTQFSSFFNKQKNSIIVLAKLASVSLVKTFISGCNAFFRAFQLHVKLADEDGQPSTANDFPEGCVADVVSDRFQIAVDTAGSVDFSQINIKLQKKLDSIVKALQSYEKKVRAPHYLEKVRKQPLYKRRTYITYKCNENFLKHSAHTCFV